MSTLPPSPESPPSRRWPVFALVLGLALRVWFVLHHARIDGDTLLYGDIARNWLQHGVYGFTRIIEGVPAYPRPTLIRLPGYPLFLALCFRIFGPEGFIKTDRYLPVMFVQALVDLGSCVLLASLSGRLFGSRARIAALWLGCLCPFTANYVAEPLTETLTLFTIALAFFSLERWKSSGAGINRWLCLIAAALSYSILLRPEQGLLAAAVVPAMFWIGLHSAHSRPVLPIVLVFLLTLLPFVPWTVRNYRTFHVLQPLAPRFANDPGEFVPLGFFRWFRTWGLEAASNDTAYWIYDGSPINIHDLPDRAFDNDAQYDATAALLDTYNQTSNATPRLDAGFNALATERIHANPLRYYIALPVGRVVDMILRPRTEYLTVPLQWWKFTKPVACTFALVYAILNFAYLTTAAVGFRRWQQAKWAGNQPIAWAMAGSILLRIALLLTIDNAEQRYTLEFFPILIICAAAAYRPATRGAGVHTPF